MKKIRDRKSELIRETVRYGAAALVFAALTAALWFLQRTVGIAALCIVCAFTAVAAVNFAVGLLIYRSFAKLSRDGAAPFAFISEYGHLEIFGGEENSARGYAAFCISAYAAMYRPAAEKPDSGELKAAKAAQRKRLSEEKALRAKFAPYRQFDCFTPADLPRLSGKTIFVSARAYRALAREEDWQAARERNTVEVLQNPPLGGAAQ